MTIFFVFCALCMLILYTLLRQRRKQYAMPPEMSGKLPLIGHAYKLISEKGGVWENVKNISREALQKGGIMTISLGLSRVYDEFSPFKDAVLETGVKEGIYTENDIRDEVNTIIMAGFDTVSMQMTYVLALLGSYQNVQQCIYEEIREVFQSSDRDVTKQDLSKLKYTEAVLKEVIRLYPIIPFVARYTYESVKLKNYTIPAGSRCFLNMFGANYHDVWGADADKFKPERWLNSNTRKNKSNTLVGFGVGRRSCIGYQYALMVMKIMVVHIIREYRIKSDISNMKIKFAFVAIPESGHEITIERRK